MFPEYYEEITEFTPEMFGFLLGRLGSPRLPGVKLVFSTNPSPAPSWIDKLRIDGPDPFYKGEIVRIFESDEWRYAKMQHQAQLTPSQPQKPAPTRSDTADDSPCK